jgi:MFS family permease
VSPGSPDGWLTARYGRKSLYVSSVLDFMIESMLCGAAQSLGQIVVFRVLRGAIGTQATHEMIGAAVTPFNRGDDHGGPGFRQVPTWI